MRLKLLLVGLGVVFLAATGFRPGTLPFIPGAPYSDAALSHWPAALYLRQSVLESGTFPLWRDGIMGAQPFAANPLNKTAYPLQWLALLLPASTHLDVMIVLHLVIAGWGMGRWARALGLGQTAAAVSALGYALGPRLLAHTGAGHLDMLYALAWWPWLMASMSPHPVSVREGTQAVSAQARGIASRAAFASGWMASLRISLFAALVVLADVRLSLFALTLAAAYALWTAWQAGEARQTLRLWPVVPLLLALTAGLVLPLLGWRPYLSRAALTPADAGVFSLAPGNLLGLLGFPTDGGNPELVTFTGLTLLALAGLALVRQGRAHLFWAVVIAVAALYAFGLNSPLWTLAVQLVPGLLWFRVPSRAWLVLALVVPLLAGYGVDGLLALLRGGLKASTRRQAQRLALVSLVAAGVGGLFLLAAFPALRGTGLTLLIGAGLALLVLLALARRLDERTFAALLLALVFADVASSGLRWLTWRGPEDWLLPGDAVASALVEDGATRVYAPYVQWEGDVLTALDQPVASASALSLFGGVDPFQLAGFVAAVQAAAGGTTRAYDVVQPPVQPAGTLTAPDASLLAVWGVTHFASPVAVESPRWVLVAEAAGSFIYRNAQPPGALNAWGWPQDWPGLPDAATVFGLNQMTLSAWALSMASFVGGLALLALYSRRRARV
jgi:hypothetical protein